MQEAEDPRAPARVARIRTDDWPERDRIEMFRRIWGGDKIRVAPRTDEPLRIDAALIKLPDLTLLWGQRSPLRAEFDDGYDRLMLNLGGPALGSQFGREDVLDRGDAILLSGSERGMLTTSQTGRVVTLAFPRAALLPFLKDPRRSCGLRIHKNTPALRLLRGYLRGALASVSAIDVALSRVAVAHIYDLAAMAVGAGRQAEEIAKGRGVRAARLQAIKHDILADIGRDMSLRDIAARHRVSPRYVRMLFESEGMSVTEFVREERLQRARAMLLSPRFAERRIAEVAYAVGFNDLSYFNRSFRRRFGRSPSEVRETEN